MAKEKTKTYDVANSFAGIDPRGDMFSGLKEDDLKERLKEIFGSKSMKYYDDVKSAIETINPKMPIALIFSVIQHESGFDPSRTSKVGAKGLMQLMPSNYQEEFTKKNGEKVKGLYPHDPTKPAENIKAGVKFLNDILNGKKYAKGATGDISKSLYGYNAGQNRKDLTTKSFEELPPLDKKFPSGGKTYVNNILTSYNRVIKGAKSKKIRKIALIGDSNAVRLNTAITGKYKNAKSFAVGSKGAKFFLDALTAFDEGNRSNSTARKLLDYFNVKEGDKPNPSDVVIHVTYLGGNDRTKNLKSYIEKEARPLMVLIKKYNGTYTGAAPTSKTCRLPVPERDAEGNIKKDENGKIIHKKDKNGKVVKYDPGAGREELNQALAVAAEEVDISFYDPIGKDRTNVPKGLRWGSEKNDCYHIQSSTAAEELNQRETNFGSYDSYYSSSERETPEEEVEIEDLYQTSPKSRVPLGDPLNSVKTHELNGTVPGVIQRAEKVYTIFKITDGFGSPVTDSDEQIKSVRAFGKALSQDSAFRDAISATYDFSSLSKALNLAINIFKGSSKAEDILRDEKIHETINIIAWDWGNEKDSDLRKNYEIILKADRGEKHPLQRLKLEEFVKKPKIRIIIGERKCK